jgi:hypothetical protein
MIRMVSYGSGRVAHWSQGQCASCAAWLKPMADRYTQSESGNAWDYVFICVACGTEHVQHDSIEPGRWAEDPRARHHAPGTRPPDLPRDPELWRDAWRFSLWEKALARDCWTMVDSLRASLTIHQVSYVWAIRRALERADLEGLVVAATKYVAMLDYEAVHGKEAMTYYGDEGDVTAIRADLDQIALEKEAADAND